MDGLRMDFLQGNHVLSSLFAMAVLGFSCEGTCRPGQFAVEGSLCCPLCLEGWFLKVNCSRPSHNITKGNQCAQCRTCGNGWKMISQCTKFSDTMCEKEVSPSTPTTAVTPVTMPVAAVFVGELALYITASVVVVLIVVASVCKWYTTRKSPEDPAKEPLKIQPITV
ncbi:hypothetical protein SRHO_G00272330 [Serrasalmus rhombeus]